VVVIALRWRWRHSTCDPPHEQLLIGLGAGGVSFVAVRGGGGYCPALALFHPRSTPPAVARRAGGGWCVIRALLPLFFLPAIFRPSTRDPPHEQVLVRLGAGAVAFVHCCHCCRCSHSLLCSVIPPAIHPTSSGSWGWGRVVCRSLSVVVAPPTHPASRCSQLWRGAGVVVVAFQPSCVEPLLLQRRSLFRQGRWG
jgi:hypothetical protein